jgi:hypothetical protein
MSVPPSSLLEQAFGELVFNQGQGVSGGTNLPVFPGPPRLPPRDQQGGYSEFAPSGYSHAADAVAANRIMEARTDPALLVQTSGDDGSDAARCIYRHSLSVKSSDCHFRPLSTSVCVCVCVCVCMCMLCSATADHAVTHFRSQSCCASRNSENGVASFPFVSATHGQPTHGNT